MLKQTLLLVAIFVLITRCAIGQQLVNAFPNLTFTYPVFVTHANDGTNRIFVLQKNGLIKVFPNDPSMTVSRTFLNLSSRIITGGGSDERGLLGLAFHPDYATNGYFFVDYTQAGTGRTIVARYSVNPSNPDTADFNSELVLLDIYQPYTNHNGGMLMFGTDGYLYVGMGDGGSACDPQFRAQNLDSLLGKILRINVDTATATTNYGIPPDNPLVGTGHREEIFAWGMRNPWRFSQDLLTGEIWVGDVGQNAWEEIDLLQGGRNYGWRNYEGLQCGTCSGATCDTTGLTFPVKVYSHSFGCSVSGGYVYRGSRRLDLVGRYLYSDYCSGNIWQFRYQNGQLTSDSLLFAAGFSVSSFGLDESGEVYVCRYSSSGSVYKFALLLSPAVTLEEPPNGANNPSRFLTYRWQSAQNAVSYWLEAGFDSTFATVARRDTALTDTSLSVGDILRDTTYYWRVRARGPSGDGPFSSTWMFTSFSLPIQPELIAPADSSTQRYDSLGFVWHSVPGALSYHFELSLDPSFSTVEVSDSTLVDTIRVATNLPFDTWHYWRVRANNGAGYGPFSSVRTFYAQEFLSVGNASNVPEQFMLYQNFPNPFNPSTRISYDVPRRSFVRLSVWNVLGQEVGVVFDGVSPPGRFTVAYDARDLPSGLYFCRLQAEGFNALRKMIVLK